MRLKIIYAVARDFSQLTPDDIREMKLEWEPFVSSGTEIEIAKIRYGSESIECIYDYAVTAPFVLEEVRKAEEEGCDAVIIGCAGDPGLYGARELVDIPVVGVGETAMLFAIGLGRRFSIIIPEKVLKGLLLTNVIKYGFASHLASVRCFEEEMNVRRLRKYVASREMQTLKRAVTEAGKKAIEFDEADALVLGCATLADVADDVSAELEVPVIHSRKAAVTYVESLRRMNLSHSKRAYMKPPQKKRLLLIEKSNADT